MSERTKYFQQLILSLGCLIAMDFVGAAAGLAQERVSIPGKISDGTPSPPGLPPKLPDFVVKETVVREMDVVEAPPMSGLPPVEGTITATVHVVEDPKLPDPPPPPIPTRDPAWKPRAVVLEKDAEWTRLVFVSATVYDRSRTLLRCHPNGNAKKEIRVWSNLDFNYFTGFSTFEVKLEGGQVRRYDLQLMGVYNEDTQKRAALLAKYGRVYNQPQIPSLPDGNPAYVFEGSTPDAGAVQLIADLHELFRCEGTRMVAAYHARAAAEAERRAYYLANPPVPKDVIVNFWERGHPVGMPASTIKQGGGD